MKVAKLTRVIELHDKISAMAAELVSLCSVDELTSDTINAILTLSETLNNKIAELQKQITIEDYIYERYFENRLN